MVAISAHLEVRHHHHVLVLQVVTVEHVLPPVRPESGEYANGSALEEDGILPPGVVRTRWVAVAREYLEMNKVKVDRMSGIAAELPDLCLPEARIGIDAVRIKLFAIYRRHSAEQTRVEIEPTRDLGIVGGLRFSLGRELIRNLAFVGFLPRYLEAHHVREPTITTEILERHLSSHRILREVHDHVEAFPL